MPAAEHKGLNGRYLCLDKGMDWQLTLWLLSTIVLLAEARTVLDADVCGAHNGRRVYLELGERGFLNAINVTTASNTHQILEGFFQHATRNDTTISHCTLELVTCPACIISVTFSHLDLPSHCAIPTAPPPCMCDHLWLSEPPYEIVSGRPVCGVLEPQDRSSKERWNYHSHTRTLTISFEFSESHRHAFSLEYTAERNRQVIKGLPEDMPDRSFLYRPHYVHEHRESHNGTNGDSEGVLTSPFFPSFYPRDLGNEHVITCGINNCRIRVIFSDYLLSGSSIMEFYDWNGQRMEVTSGSIFRPTVIISSGPSLLARFYANGGTGLGYKAKYSFISSLHLHDPQVRPVTDKLTRGRSERDEEWDNMLVQSKESLLTLNFIYRMYNWALIVFFFPKLLIDRISYPYVLRIMFYCSMEDCGGSVETLGGAITMMNMVEDVLGENNPSRAYDCVWLVRPPTGYLHLKTHLYLKIATLVDMGFYVSLRGSFGIKSRVAIVYTAFGYVDCYAGSEFLCLNRRCIPVQLHCDGFDHCGDNSDEPSTCYREWETEHFDRRWYSHTPNYYFPKAERYPDLKTATMVFIISSLGLVVLISALIVLLYRMGSRARQQRDLQTRLQTISDLLDSGRMHEFPLSDDDPPCYEAPPEYDEIIKVGLESALTLIKSRRALECDDIHSQSTTSRRITMTSSSSHSLSLPTPALLKVVLPPDNSDTGPLLPTNSDFLDIAVAGTSRSSQTTPVPYLPGATPDPPSGTGSTLGRIPDSPPPPYASSSYPNRQSSSSSGEESLVVTMALSRSSLDITDPTQGSECDANTRESWLMFRNDDTVSSRNDGAINHTGAASAYSSSEETVSSGNEPPDTFVLARLCDNANNASQSGVYTPITTNIVDATNYPVDLTKRAEDKHCSWPEGCINAFPFPDFDLQSSTRQITFPNDSHTHDHLRLPKVVHGCECIEQCSCYVLIASVKPLKQRYVYINEAFTDSTRYSNMTNYIAGVIFTTAKFTSRQLYHSSQDVRETSDDCTTLSMKKRFSSDLLLPISLASGMKIRQDILQADIPCNTLRKKKRSSANSLESVCSETIMINADLKQDRFPRFEQKSFGYSQNAVKCDQICSASTLKRISSTDLIPTISLQGTIGCVKEGSIMKRKIISSDDFLLPITLPAASFNYDDLLSDREHSGLKGCLTIPIDEENANMLEVETTFSNLTGMRKSSLQSSLPMVSFAQVNNKYTTSEEMNVSSEDDLLLPVHCEDVVRGQGVVHFCKKSIKCDLTMPTSISNVRTRILSRSIQEVRAGVEDYVLRGTSTDRRNTV